MSDQLPLFGAPAGDEPPASNDVGLTLPLHGVRLIEASAGTGKTFALTTLVLRLLLERGATMAQILAVTFTRAATQELRQRIRRRLRLAKRLLDAPVDAPTGEAVPTQAVLRAAIARDGAQRVRERVEAALLQLDEATISTIHGFCHRALREFGFRAGLLADSEIVDNAGDVWNDVAAELWRAAANALPASGEPDPHALMTALWDTPDDMAKTLPKLCDASREMYPTAGESDAAAALHALRADAIARYEARMRERGQSDQDQLIARVWRASEDPAFAAALAARWPLLLIDEFQDTDPRQWDIFRRMFEAGEREAGELQASELQASELQAGELQASELQAGELQSSELQAAATAEKRWLCLIGDPKQAIYRFRGGDLQTYLEAKRYARSLEGEAALATLDDNYRSTPAVLRAVETLFRASPLPFVEERVDFVRVGAAGDARDDDLRVGDAPVPGMTLHWLPAMPPDPTAGPRSAASRGIRTKEQEFALMREAAVHAVVDLLARGTLRERDAVRRLRPADIAILTGTNDQAAEMQRALVQAGVAAATLSGDSVFSGEAAEDLHALLASLLEPADIGRFRAALATRLLGVDAAGIVALDADDAALQAWSTRFAQAAASWRARGPLPALLPFVVDAAPRWLAQPEGARRLTDALHLAELLQAESALRGGPAEQLQWFARQRAQGVADEARQLRLESDSGMVQIATIHRSKGLEYPVVVLPFVAYRGARSASGLYSSDFHDARRRPARAWTCKGVLEPADGDAIKVHVAREEQAEAQRQLYVALTRAKHALHVVWSRNDAVESTAMHWLLHAGEPTGRAKDALDYAGMQARIERLARDSDGAISVRPFDPAAPLPRIDRAGDADATMPDARAPRRRFATDLRLHSFSSLHARSEDGDAARGAGDEAPTVAADPGEGDTLGGTAFGNAVHAVLEEADAGAWARAADDDEDHDQDHDEDRIPSGQRALVEHALLRQGLAATPSHLAQTARLVSRALNVVLPGGVRLCALPAARRIRELPFHFRLGAVRVDAIHALLQAHGYPRARRASQATLEGLMHGFVDLVYRDDEGRHHVLDYKTNRLSAYDPAALRRAVAQSDYDLQYLIYLVALRRWLRLRHGDAYDDARHLGGAVYLFLRGIDPRAGGLEGALDGDDVSRRGVHVDAVDPSLLAALDALFDGRAA